MKSVNCLCTDLLCLRCESFLGSIAGVFGHEQCWALGMLWGAAQEGFHSLTSALPLGHTPRSLCLSTLQLPGCFLSISMSVSRVTAKCFPTLPLPRLPFQHRGKYCAHTFPEYFLNDWMFVWGDHLHHPVLWGFVAVTVVPLWLHFFPCSPLFLVEIQHLGFTFTWEASAFSKSFVSHQAEHADNYQVECWLLFWIDMLFHPDFQPANKGTHGYLQAATPPVFSFSGFGAIDIRMPQSEGMAIRRMHSDPHGLAHLPKLVSIPAVPHVKSTGCRCSSLYFLGDTPPLLFLVLPEGILLFFIFFRLAAFQRQRHLIILSASPSMLSLCCTSTDVTLLDGL